MQLTTFFEVAEDFRSGMDLVRARRSLGAALRTAEADQEARLHDARVAFLTRAHEMEEGFERMREVVAATDGLIDLHELYGQEVAIERRIRGQAAQTLAAARAIDEFVRTDLPKKALTPALSEIAAAARAAPPSVSLESFMATLLGPARDVPLNRRRLGLRKFHRTRLRHLHRSVVTRIAAAKPTQATESGFPDVKEFSSASRALRTAAQAFVGQLNHGQVYPGAILAVWSALQRWEDWLEVEAVGPLVQTLAAAHGDRSEKFKWARRGALLYDEVRRGLAYCAGLREMLIAAALQDEESLERFAKTSTLPVGSVQLDLARTAVAELSSCEPDTVVELDGIVTEAVFRPGGPEPRTELELTDSAGDCITVIVPYASVDSFGVDRGAWLQARGRFPASARRLRHFVRPSCGKLECRQ